MALVSVIIPAYNQDHYLGDTIRSVLAQTNTVFEVIVVDDGSTDDTAQVVQDFSDRRIRYIHQENRGLPAARNTGIQNSNGPYLSFLDSDDFFLPDKLALLVTALEDDPELGLVAGQAIPTDSQGQPIGEIFDRPPPDEPSQLLLGNPSHVGSVLLRRTWQEQVGFFDEFLPSYEDWDMWLRLAIANCKMGWVAEPISYYRFHPAQMTRIGDQMTESTFAVLDKIYDQPDLPDEWYSMRELAYSNASLRAAAQAYHATDLTMAKAYLAEAIRLNPTLLADESSLLARKIAGWTSLPKTSNPLVYLERIYFNLPDCLDTLGHRRRHDLGQIAIQFAFSSYQRGDLDTAQYAVMRAFLYQPRWLLNCGAVAIFVRLFLSPLITRRSL